MFVKVALLTKKGRTRKETEVGERECESYGKFQADTGREDEINSLSF